MSSLAVGLQTLDIITHDLKTTLESTERAVSQLLHSSHRSSPSIRSPAQTPNKSKQLRKILHHSHSRFKRLILAQHEEIATLRKALRAAPSSVAVTPSSTSLYTPNATKTATPATAAVAARPIAPVETTVAPKTPTHRNKSVQKQQQRALQVSTLRKRVVDLLKRHRTLSTRLTGKESEDRSTLVEIRSITSKLADMGIHVDSPSPSPTLASHTAQDNDDDDDAKHFEYLFAKIMSGPAKPATAATTSLPSVVQQQLFVSTPSPGRRRAKVLRAKKNCEQPPSLLYPSVQSPSSLLLSSSIAANSTPPRNSAKTSPRNPTPGSRKRARIASRNDAGMDVSSASKLQQAELHEAERVVATALRFTSPSSTSNEGSTPPRLFVRTPPQRTHQEKRTARGGAHNIDHPAEQQEQQEHHRQQHQQHHHHNLEERLENAMVGSPFPPMSPILEPMDRSAVFAPDDIMSDLNVVKKLSMYGTKYGSKKETKRVSASPPVNGLMAS